MSLTDTDILSRFSSFTVAHPQFNIAMGVINEAIETTRIRSEPSSVLLLGDAGTGKTRICDILTAKNGGTRVESVAGGVAFLRPVICCPVPPNATIKGLVDRILKELGSTKNNHPLCILEDRLFTLLETCKTLIIILDEWHHLISRGAEPTRNAVCNWVKVLANTFKGTVILSGMLRSEQIVDGDEQLAGRFPFRAYLRNFSLSTTEDIGIYYALLTSFSREISRSMPFEKIPSLTDEHLALALYAFCAGNLRFLRVLLHIAIKSALTRNNGIFSIEDLVYAANRVHNPKCLIKNNPFELTLDQLQKCIRRRAR